YTSYSASKSRSIITWWPRRLKIRCSSSACAIKFGTLSIFQLFKTGRKLRPLNTDRLFHKTQRFEIGFNGGVQFGGFGLLLPPAGDEPLHFFVEGFAVVFLFGGADVAAGGEHVAVLADFFQVGRFAESGDVPVFAGALCA